MFSKLNIWSGLPKLSVAIWNMMVVDKVLGQFEAGKAGRKWQTLKFFRIIRIKRGSKYLAATILR
jgi:hypothetical protein